MNFIRLISYATTSGLGNEFLDKSCDFIVWYAKDISNLKYRSLFFLKYDKDQQNSPYSLVEEENLHRRRMTKEEKNGETALDGKSHIYRIDNLVSQSGGEAGRFSVKYNGKTYKISKGSWKTSESGMERLVKANRLESTQANVYYVRKLNDFCVMKYNERWTDTVIAGFASDKNYVVQTSSKVIERCVLR